MSAAVDCALVAAAWVGTIAVVTAPGRPDRSGGPAPGDPAAHSAVAPDSGAALAAEPDSPPIDESWAEPSDEELRPALELGFAVAVTGARLRPPIPPPPALKRFLKFAKLPSGALAPVRKALEDDSAFRERTARIATEELAGGRLGVLWLSRPVGWQAEVAALVVTDVADGELRPTGPASARAEQRRREAAETALARARAELVAAQAEAVQLRAAAADAVDAVARAEAARAAAEDRAEAARATGERHRRHAEQADGVNERLSGELAAARTRIAELEVARDEALTARQTAEDLLAVVASDGGLPPAPPATPVVAPQRTHDPAVLDAAGRLATRISEVAAALGTLGSELAVTIAGFAGDGGGGGGGSGVVPPDRVGDSVLSASRLSEPVFPPAGTVALGDRPRRAAGRRPAAIPGALAADGVEAALHLMRRPGVVTVVDGYNVAKLGWPDLPLADQRDSCLDALEDLVRRLGVRFQVVFDGADVGAVPSGRRLVRVRFTASGITADDEIRGLVLSMPADQPVVVASNDREVNRAARAAGANVISSDQLLAVARR